MEAVGPAGGIHMDFLEINDPSILPRLVHDAVLSTMRALSHATSEDSDTLAAFDRLTERAEIHGLGPALDEAVIGNRLAPEVLAIVLLNVLPNLGRVDPEAVHSTTTLLQVYTWGTPEFGRSTSGALVASALDVAGSLAEILAEGAFDRSSTITAATALSRLATSLADEQHSESSLACATSAASIADQVDEQFAEPYLRQAADLALQFGAEDAAAMSLVRHAHNLAKIAAKSPSRKIDAFDAMEAAVRRLASCPKARNGVIIENLRGWLSGEQYLRPLSPLFWLAMPAEMRPDLGIGAEVIEAMVHPVYEGQFTDWVLRWFEAREVMFYIENKRLELLPKAQAENAVAEWGSWKIIHPNLLRSVFHGESMLREGDKHNLLLTLAHEVTHIYSLFGSIGLALSAMRWAHLELEIRAWTLGYDASRDGPVERVVRSVLTEGLPAQFPSSGEDQLVHLALAEQIVELERKRQIFEGVWSHWFEGLAVFGELAADPLLDDELSTPVMEVILNLWEGNDLRQKFEQRNATSDEAMDAFRKRWVEAEEQYSAALRGHGEDRLRTYLTTHHSKYLAGYLAVRSIVTTWRAKMNVPLSGTRAFCILLHCVRFWLGDLVPDLGLSTDEFRVDALDRHLRWLEALCAISSEDLELIFRAGSTDRCYWVDGKLVSVEDVDDPEAVASKEATEFIDSLSRQALEYRPSAERVPRADGHCREIIKMMDDIRADRFSLPMMFTADKSGLLLSPLYVLPIGECQCPFWLFPATKSIAVLVRTREHDKDTHNPAYDMIYFPLETDQFEDLLSRVRSGRDTRMTVSRMADLVRGFDGRGFGRNVLVFQYGDWIHIQPRGIFFGSEEVPESLAEAVKMRLQPSPLMRALDRVTGPEHLSGRRTLAWVDECEWSLSDDRCEANVQPWADYVAEIARSTLSEDAVLGTEIRRRLLEFVLGPIDANERILEQGLAHLQRGGEVSIEQLIRLLHDSAQSPSADSGARREIAEAVRRNLTALIELTPLGWDVVEPNGVPR